MFTVGRLCTKIAGRDAGRKCVIVDVLEEGYVLIDGQTRRRKCNITHLEPSGKELSLKKGATHEDVKKVLSKENIEMRDTKPKKTPQRPKKMKKEKIVPEKVEKKPTKAAPKKEKVVSTPKTAESKPVVEKPAGEKEKLVTDKKN